MDTEQRARAAAPSTVLIPNASKRESHHAPLVTIVVGVKPRPRRCSHLQGQNRMTTKQCPICATSDQHLIRTCPLRGVIPACLGSSNIIAAVATRMRPEDQKIATDD